MQKPANSITLPTTIFVGLADFGGRFGLSTIGDFWTSIEDAANAMAGTNGNPDTARVFQIDLCAETNLPEAITDVTDDCRKIAAGWALAAE